MRVRIGKKTCWGNSWASWGVDEVTKVDFGRIDGVTRDLVS